MPRSKKVIVRLRKDRFKPIKGKYEPWLVTLSLENPPHTLIKMLYECPHCNDYFHNRHAVERHCKGKTGQFPATCRETQQGGKCFSGCTHP
jgi:hypothetical protein